jgi:hypothetical protein
MRHSVPIAFIKEVMSAQRSALTKDLYGGYLADGHDAETDLADVKRVVVAGRSLCTHIDSP